MKAGDPLFFDKVREEVLFVAPVSGEISEIIRGERRKIIEIRILADKEIEYKTFKKYTKTEINTSVDHIKYILSKTSISQHICLLH